MGYPAPIGKFEAKYANGTPLAGGQVWTYQAGTSTPTATYSDSGLTIANANPVILDAAGRADIWIPDASVMQYKWIITDANGVLQYSANGISITPPGSTGSPAPPPPTGGPPNTTYVYVLMPPGLICPYGGAGVPQVIGGSGPVLNPDGSQAWLPCDGSSVSATTYANLFGVIANKFGQTGGAGYFNVPDMRGHFPLGVSVTGTGSVIGQVGGLLNHQHGVPVHNHSQTDHTHPMPHEHTVPFSGWQSGTWGTAPPGMAAGQLMVIYSGQNTVMNPALADSKTTAIDTASTGGQGPLSTGNSIAMNTTAPTPAASVDPPYVAVNYIIKT